MTIDENFFIEVHSFFKKISSQFILPNIGNLNNNEVSDKSDNSKVTKYDLVVEKELINFFNKKGFKNIISEEYSSELIDQNDYLTIDPIDGTRNFINGINKVVMMVSYIDKHESIFSIIYNPIDNIFYHTINNTIYKNFKKINKAQYNKHIGFLGDHAKVYFKDLISDITEKKRSRSIGYDVIEVIEGERTFMTIYGSKIWDLFPAMSFLKILRFKSNLPNMNFDYSKLNEKIIFYAEI
tara:strand:+ start:88 stop:804 length:717 start_codon:yes stop_codon:yes gene_type:complete